MDARLVTIRGHRPVFLRKDDCPKVARAIVAYTRGGVRAHRLYEANVGAVWLEGPDVDVLVRIEDWERILPCLADGTFTPSPVAPAAGDPDLYARVLATLQALFPQSFPTSPL